jgi:pimeloyl-ACP methyl ester carboxylesterase
MNNFRTWGKPPYEVIVVHGGPGLPGSAAPVARELSRDTGVIELLETRGSVEGQITELAEVLKEHADLPAILVGHSWGTVLCYMTAARYPDLVRKLILVSTPALEIQDRPEYLPVWLSRLPEKERVEMVSLQEFVCDGQEGDKSQAMAKLFRLIARADSYAPLPIKDEVLEYQPDINMSVGQEFMEMLESKELLNLGRKIKCPVVAIHGDYDLRPARVVREPFSGLIKDFRFYLLEKCGHYPWIERYARDKFFKVLREEITHGLAGD